MRIKTTFIIEAVPSSGGYWDELYNSFRGYLFATHYDSNNEAEGNINAALTKSAVATACKITTVYSKK